MGAFGLSDDDMLRRLRRQGGPKPRHRFFARHPSAMWLLNFGLFALLYPLVGFLLDQRPLDDHSLWLASSLGAVLFATVMTVLLTTKGRRALRLWDERSAEERNTERK